MFFEKYPSKELTTSKLPWTEAIFLAFIIICGKLKLTETPMWYQPETINFWDPGTTQQSLLFLIREKMDKFICQTCDQEFVNEFSIKRHQEHLHSDTG